MTRPGVGSVVPAQGQQIVGREEDLALISSLLKARSDRMITLVGPGGIGKSRLAAEAAREARDRGVQVHWVRLARLAKDADSAAVEREVGSAVITADYSQRNTWQALVDTLDQQDKSGRPRPVVLVLDNCEHVLSGLQLVIPALLDTIPGLIIMATSTCPTGWTDERLVPVRQLREADAVTLFRLRAERSGCAPIAASEEDMVAEICAHVGRNPLFIQLAASRLRHQSLVSLRAEVTGRADDKRMEWTAGPRAAVEDRHLGITNVIAWSHGLLTEEEKLLWERMSVFAAGGDTEGDTASVAGVGADLEAIVAICGDHEQAGDDGRVTLPRHEIKLLLEGLVEKSLVTNHISRTTVRYSVVESLRLFARDRLAERGANERSQLERRHMHYYRDKVVDAAGRWFSPAERELLDWATAAWGNIVTAIETSINTGEADAGLEICGGLIQLRLPFFFGSIREFRRWTERCLEASEKLTPRPEDLQLAAKSALAWMLVRQGQSDDATRLLAECITACVPGATNWRSDPVSVERLPAILDLALGTFSFMSGRDPSAVDVLLRARRKFHESGNHGAGVLAGMFAGLAAATLDEAGKRACEISTETVQRARQSGASWVESWALLALAVTRIKHGDPAEAAEILRGTLAHQMEVGDQWGAAWSVELRCWALAAMITAGATDRERAATELAHLAGGLKTLRSRLGVDIDAMGTFADQCHEAVNSARGVLGDVTFIAQMNRGAQQLDPATHEVHLLALGELTLDSAPAAEQSVTDPAAAPWESLTKAEKEVARLVAANWQNARIATSLGKSVRTVEGQVAAIFAKLNVSSRGQVHDYVPEKYRLRTEQVGMPYAVGRPSARRPR
ncbi:helix-turn-helix transcriptional regulator [Nocardia abscessus]|uniref:helix-turn-helix transcriptional regulator n=1 Tax=Nocardia abscessus TaxID=120957 RepID=UPI002455C331|nr:AAA family ATPase [Nocardia abscessus]